MLVPRPQLIPSAEQVREFLRETGALREGHFEFPNGYHSEHYFQMPLAMRYHGNARVLNVALSRLLRREPEVRAALPNCAIVAPAAGGIPVAFGIREALSADQIFWAEKDDGRYYLRQYLDVRGVKCILVDDIVRSGKVIHNMLDVIHNAGAEVVAIGSIVHFNDTQLEVGDIPYYSLLHVDSKFVTTDKCSHCKSGGPLEKVWM
ncbi:MAG TPA: phosphoribosyltransferase family protein [Blastocatellia bacterium]|nr:phosphoribosyltransferase family protein [Blastocatellia bacterium]